MTDPNQLFFRLLFCFFFFFNIPTPHNYLFSNDISTAFEFIMVDNDECTDAISLVGGTPTDGTTSGATQPAGGEYNSGECTDTDETNSVWYTYEVPPTDKGFHMIITGAAVDGLMGDINLVVFEDDPVGVCATGAGA
ncbi:MAG: hypothetical protein ACJA1A_001820, partial [Saprospiraceae bacterium]